MAMDIDPFSMLEVSLQEGPDIIDDRRIGQNPSSGVMHQVENDVLVHQPPPPLHYFGSDLITPQRAVLSNIQKLSSTSKDEEKFRRRAYSSISLVLRKRLHCTICDAHIGAYLGLKEMDIEHPLLKVLACPKCTLKYHYLDFPLNIDGRDVRCRWCTNISKEDAPLRYCNYCPFAFCEMCIYRNLPLDELASNKSNWVCFVCNVKDLWPSRAVLWALRVLIDTNLALKEEKKWSTDQSTCCKNKVPKQRRMIPLPQGGGQPTNGHNVAVRAAVLPNQFRMSSVQNNYRMPYNRAPTPSIIRPVVVPQQTAYRAIRPAVTLPVPVIANSSTQLYDTSWLTDKVSNISTTLLNLNNNLHRLAQGIPEKENKYSIKSKMISMVSLLNISATQLQKASKEMEEESKRILDKNYRVARINPVVSSENKPVVASTSKPVVSSLGKRPPPRSRSTSSKRSRRRRRASQADSDSDPDDPDFRTKAKVDGLSDDDYEVEEDETSRSFTRSYETRACFVKLERLSYKYVAGYDSGSESESKSDAGSRSEEPQPSTSFAPDASGTVPPSELPDRRDADSGSGDAESRGEGLKKREADEIEHKSKVIVDDVATSKETDDFATPKETGDAETPKETDVAATPKETDDAATSKETDNAATPKETDDAATPKETDGAATPKEIVDAATPEETDDAATPKETDAATPKETDDVATPKETDDAATPKETDDAATPKETDDAATPKETVDSATSKETDDLETSKESDDSSTSKETDDSSTSEETNDSETSKETDDGEESKPQSEPMQAVEVTATDLSQSKDVTDKSKQDIDAHKPSPTPVSEENKPWAESQVDDNAANMNEGNRSSSMDTSSADSTLDSSGDTSRSDSTE